MVLRNWAWKICDLRLSESGTGGRSSVGWKGPNKNDHWTEKIVTSCGLLVVAPCGGESSSQYRIAVMR